MKTILGTTVAIVTLALLAGACGDDSGDDDGTSGSGGSGASGAPGMAGKPSTGGAGSSGMAGAGTAGNGTAGNGTAGNGTAGNGTAGSGGGGGVGKCSPGKTIPTAFAYPDYIQNCGFVGKGELEGVDGIYRSIKLATPIGPGDVYAFSVDVSELADGTMQLWGGTGECGEAHEKLDTAIIPEGASGALCMTAKPATGTYPYLIWVLESAGEHGEVTFCPDVSCPGE